MDPTDIAILWAAMALPARASMVPTAIIPTRASMAIILTPVDMAITATSSVTLSFAAEPRRLSIHDVKQQ